MAFLTDKVPSSELKTADPKAILVLESSDHAWRELKDVLQSAGFAARRVIDTDAAAHELSRHDCGIFLIDLKAPHRGVMDFVKRVSVQSDIGIILLAHGTDRIDRVLALELGADDVIEKPYDPRELAARLRRLARRLERHPRETLSGARRHAPQWSLDRVHRIVSADGLAPVPLTPAEFRLLDVFMQHPGKVLAREFLLDALFGHASAPLDRSIDITVTRLRRKLEYDPRRPRYIKTIRLAGYCFDPDGRAE